MPVYLRYTADILHNCWKWFDVINLCPISLDDMHIATLQFYTNKAFNGKPAHKCIRMGITIFKIFLLRGILSDIRSESCLAAPLTHRCKTKFQTIFYDIHPKMKILNPLYYLVRPNESMMRITFLNSILSFEKSRDPNQPASCRDPH